MSTTQLYDIFRAMTNQQLVEAAACDEASRWKVGVWSMLAGEIADRLEAQSPAKP
jgi:hypothetical protein